MEMKTGLILSGGGARAAYQVGVLQAVADILPKGTRQPFPIITGTSAGALNALGLAGRPGTFRQRVTALASIWSSLESASIYRTSGLAVALNALKIATSVIYNPSNRSTSLALLDNQPLRELLEEAVQFTHIEHAISRGELEAIGLTAMNYSNGHSTTFFQGQKHIKPWSRSRRNSIVCKLEVEHLLASAALPTLFPATRIGHHYFGDGALRQTRPLGAAIRLGADRLFIIGVADNMGSEPPPPMETPPPTIAQVLGQMLNGVFLDSIDADLESLHRVNDLLRNQDESEEASDSAQDLRPIDALIVSPSQSLSNIARHYIDELPRSTRWFLNFTGSVRDSGSGGALSYILFEPGFCKHLLSVGYEDAMRDRDRIADFFAVSPSSSVRSPKLNLESSKLVVHKSPHVLSRVWSALVGKKSTRS